MRNERSIDTGMPGIPWARFLRRHCLGLPFLFCLVVLSAGCASSRGRKAAEPPPPSPYMRVAHPDAAVPSSELTMSRRDTARGQSPGHVPFGHVPREDSGHVERLELPAHDEVPAHDVRRRPDELLAELGCDLRAPHVRPTISGK